VVSDGFRVETRSVAGYEDVLAEHGLSVGSVWDAAALIASREAPAKGWIESRIHGLNPGGVERRLAFYAERPFTEAELDSAYRAAAHVALLESRFSGAAELDETLVEFFCRGVAGEVEAVSSDSVRAFIALAVDSHAIAVWSVG